MIIDFEVYDLEIICCEMPELVDDSTNYIKARFVFEGSIWDDACSKSAVFKTEDRAYRVELENNECYIPTQVLKEEKFVVGVCGERIEGELYKSFYSKECVVPTVPSCFSYKFNEQMNTPDSLERIKRLEDVISDLKENANDLFDVKIPTHMSELENDMDYVDIGMLDYYLSHSAKAQYEVVIGSSPTIVIKPNHNFVVKPYNAEATATVGENLGIVFVETDKFYLHFNENYGVVKEYAFTYNGDSWLLYGDPQNLNDCGVSFSGTAQVGDVITIMLKDTVSYVGLNINDREFDCGSEARVSFRASRACSVGVNSYLLWHGDDIVNGIFDPQADKIYEIYLRNNGMRIVAEVTAL